MSPVKRAEAIKRIRTAARSGTLRFREHAEDEMISDLETHQSVAWVLAHAKIFVLQDNGLFRVSGDELTVVVKVMDHAVIVWTVFV